MDSWRLCLVPVNICRDVLHKNGVLCLCQQAARPAVSLKADKYKISHCHLKVTGLLCMAALCISAPDWEETSLWLNTERPSLSTGGGAKSTFKICVQAAAFPLWTSQGGENVASGLPKPSRGRDRWRQEVISHLLPSLEDHAQQPLSQEGVQPTGRHWVSIQTIQAAQRTSFCYVCIRIWCSDLQMCARFVFLVPCVDFDNACWISPRTDVEEQHEVRWQK